MKKAISLLSLFLMTALLCGQANAQTVEELMVSAHKLENNKNEGLALVKYKKVLEIDANNYEALCGGSLLYARVGNRQSGKEKQGEYFKKAKDLATRAIEQNTTHAEGHFVMGIAMGRMAIIASSKERVAASKEIKAEFEEALRYDTKHAGAWHGLGRWNIRVANLSFAERAAANLLFGGLPEGASNENALKCYKNSLEHRPNYILYMYDLATAYYYSKNNGKTKEILEKLIKLSPQTEDDPGIQEEAKMMLSEL